MKADIIYTGEDIIKLIMKDLSERKFIAPNNSCDIVIESMTTKEGSWRCVENRVKVCNLKPSNL
jgi:hypothetical protein